MSARLRNVQMLFIAERIQCAAGSSCFWVKTRETVKIIDKMMLKQRVKPIYHRLVLC